MHAPPNTAVTHQYQLAVSSARVTGKGTLGGKRKKGRVDARHEEALAPQGDTPGESQGNRRRGAAVLDRKTAGRYSEGGGESSEAREGREQQKRRATERRGGVARDAAQAWAGKSRASRVRNAGGRGWRRAVGGRRRSPRARWSNCGRAATWRAPRAISHEGLGGMADWRTGGQAADRRLGLSLP